MENCPMPAYPHCVVVLVTQRAIESMLENSGQGFYRDAHPWVVAAQLFNQAQAEQSQMPILFGSVSEGQAAVYSHWSMIRNIDVLSLTSNRWESRCEFGELHAVNPIWQDIDSVMHKASAEQVLREQVEGIRTLRMPLQENQIHPYAICETPGFVLAERQAIA